MTKRTIRVEIEADNRFPRLPPAHLHPLPSNAGPPAKRQWIVDSGKRPKILTLTSPRVP